MDYSAGFLIVKTFARMYRDYLTEFEELRQLRSDFNRNPVPLERMPGRYRGVARNPMEAWIEEFTGSGLFEEPTGQELAASLFMRELCDAGKAEGFFVFALEDARKIFGMIQPPVEREIIWARRIDKSDTPPPETIFLGYEPIDFYGDFTSLITGVWFFRYSRNFTIEEPYQIWAKTHFPRLNKWGLFDVPTYAQEYVDSFPRLPEHERPRHIAEVRAFEGN